MKKSVAVFTFILLLTALSGAAAFGEQDACPMTADTAAGKPIARQVAAALAEESNHGKIKAVIFDFGISSADPGKKLPDDQVKDLGNRLTEEFTADLLRQIKDSGKRDTISVIDRSRLDDILRQKKLSAKDVSERTAIEIAGMAGLDIAITGHVYIVDNSSTTMAKVIRVKDGEILAVAKDEGREKAVPAVHTPVTVIDKSEKIKIGEWKALPLDLPYAGTLAVTVRVIEGNAVEVYVIPDKELENFKNHDQVDTVAGFAPVRARSYHRSAAISNGKYYLVLRDSSLGTFSKRSDDIQVNVKLQP